MSKNLPGFDELQRLEKLISKIQNKARVDQIAQVSAGQASYPIYRIEIGSEDLSKPTLGLIGGVHGLERVGTQLAISYLEHLFEIMDWDEDTHKRLQECRIVSIPLLNPGGMAEGTRCNPNGVDLNRNAPIEASEKPAFLIGGHRISPKLPWYRGAPNQAMEIEAQALCQTTRERIFPARASMVLDLHSGFGAIDRLWYPYARSREDFPKMEEVHRIHGLLNKTYPNHVYHLESQSKSYTTHGDLWDYLFDEFHDKHKEETKVFLPWTLEMGSWLWIRKNPTQLFSTLGVFNPIKTHRFRRIMRRHLTLIDFFLKAVRNYSQWTKPA